MDAADEGRILPSPTLLGKAVPAEERGADVGPTEEGGILPPTTLLGIVVSA